MLTNFAIRKTVLLIAVSAWFCVSVVSVVPLEAQAVRGTIQGTVKDPSGAALPGVTVDIKNVGTGVAQSVVTNDEGRFTAPDLQLGDYEVQASLSGFQTVLRRGVTLTVGSQRIVDFTMPLGTVEETITVESSVPLVDTVSAAVGATIEQKQIADLPLNGRNFSQLISLAPGATQVPFGNTGGNVFFGRQPNFAIAGARPEGQAFLLDNTNIQGFWNRGSGSGVLGTTLGVEAIAEFQTLTNTYSAQFGGAGGVVNAVTKSGSNQIHGSVFEYVRDSSMDAKNFFDGETKPEFNKHQFGGSVSGPIAENKAFFFVTYEGIRQDQGATKIVTVPDLNARNGLIPVNGVLTNVGVNPAIRPLLDLYPLPTTQLSGGLGQVSQVETSPADEDYFLGRFDYTLSDKSSLFGRYVRDTANIFDPFAGSNIPLWGADQRTNNQYLTVESRRIMSSTLINQLRFGFVRTRENARTSGFTPLLDFFPGEDRQNGRIAAGGGITEIGSINTLPVDLEQNKYSIADDVYWNRGNHSIKLGASLDANRTLMDQPFQEGGVWTFTGLQSFLTNTPSQLVGALPGQGEAQIRINELGITSYVHDEWRALSNLTLNLGLRYAFMVNPDVTPAFALVDGANSVAFTAVEHAYRNNPSLKNFDPRVGFAYDPFADHKTSIRGGFGLFHNLIAPRIIGPNYVNNPPYGYARQQFPTFPLPFFSPTAIAPTPTVQNGLNYDTDTTPYYSQWNINVQREILASTSVTIGYVGSRGVNLLRQRDINPVTPTTLADGTVIYGVPRPTSAGITLNPRVNPTFSSLVVNSPDAPSTYHSFQASLNRRFYQNIQAQISYTLSQCRDQSSGSFGGEGSTPATNPYDPAYDEGPCHFDRPHNLRASGIVALPFTGNKWVEGWQVSAIVTAMSGQPFTPAIGFNQSGLDTANQRPNLAPGRSLDDAVTGNYLQWFDPTVFTLPAPGTLGTVGRHTLRAPNLVNVDMSLIKDVTLPSISDEFRLQFRVEVFNLLNRVNFLLPNASIFTQTPNGGGTYSATAGRITEAGPARQIQIAVKAIF